MENETHFSKILYLFSLLENGDRSKSSLDVNDDGSIMYTTLYLDWIHFVAVTRKNEDASFTLCITCSSIYAKDDLVYDYDNYDLENIKRFVLEGISKFNKDLTNHYIEKSTLFESRYITMKELDYV